MTLFQHKMVERLFVYGTLAPGRPNEHILGAIGGTWRKASVKGILRNEGWGADMGYPGLIIDEKGKRVEGFLFSSANLSTHWTTLDEFEGRAYQRILTKVALADKSVIEAYVYVLR